ncbi:MAG TPA: hypothetical protein PKI59_00105 [Candidatus Cloacimonadota bacterium]|nr:hypothetical protein [Candidatus Cloacimonadota bacterium]
MKIYRNPILTLIVQSCRECPNRISRPYKNGNKYSMGWVCKAITLKHKDPVNGTITAHPSVRYAMMQDGYLDDCPLEDKGE